MRHLPIFLTLLLTCYPEDRVSKDAITITTNSNQISDSPLEKFEFLQQPQDRDVNQGQLVRLSCVVGKVKGKDYQYQYVWYKYSTFPGVITVESSENIISGNMDTLLISSVEPQHGGHYVCKVTLVDTTHTIFSNSGKLTVYYYKSAAENPRDMTAPENEKMIQLLCDVPESNPIVDVVWYKNNEKISGSPRMFVMPEDSRIETDLKRGSLIIMYVEEGDRGKYFCRTTYRGEVHTLTSYFLTIDGSKHISDKLNANVISAIAGESTIGGTAVFYCAGIGKPPPNITWTKDNMRVESSDSVTLEDNKRRLVISNVQQIHDGAYECTLTVADLLPRSTIQYLTILPSVTDITFVTRPTSRVIYPNKYNPFSLECSIDYAAFFNIDGNLKPVMYWLKDGKQLSSSRRMKHVTRENEESQTLESTIEFVTPNESDLGIYQCIAQGTEQIRQATAHVNVRKVHGGYQTDRNEKYKAFKMPMRVDKAEEHCQAWSPNGHLVSIMSKKEAGNIVQLLKEADIKKSWIGLTSEDYHYPGTWKWTQPADRGDFFSYWAEDNPDNKEGNEEYAIMDVDVGGRWLDVRNNAKYPFVCKLYESYCSSVAEYFEGKAEPLNRVENKRTQYGVGETITIICSDKAVALKETITCGADSRFDPDGIACPIYGNASPHHLPSVSYTLLALLLNTVFHKLLIN